MNKKKMQCCTEDEGFGGFANERAKGAGGKKDVARNGKSKHKSNSKSEPKPEHKPEAFDDEFDDLLNDLLDEDADQTADVE